MIHNLRQIKILTAWMIYKCPTFQLAEPCPIPFCSQSGVNAQHSPSGLDKPTEIQPLLVVVKNLVIGICKNNQMDVLQSILTEHGSVVCDFHLKTVLFP